MLVWEPVELLRLVEPAQVVLGLARLLEWVAARPSVALAAVVRLASAVRLIAELVELALVAAVEQAQVSVQPVAVVLARLLPELVELEPVG